MTWVDLLILLVIAGVCGAIGQTIAGYSRGGCLTAIAVGLLVTWYLDPVAARAARRDTDPALHPA